MRKTNNVLALIIGGVIGSVITYATMKTKIQKQYDDKLADELTRMREYYKKNAKKEKPVEEKLVDDIKADAELRSAARTKREEKESLDDYVKRNYTDYSTHMQKGSKKGSKMNYLSVYADEEEYAESPWESFTYYYDGETITDGDGEEVKLPEYFNDQIDLDEEFTKANESKIFIRNSLLECDYEIEYKGDFYPNLGGDDE